MSKNLEEDELYFLYLGLGELNKLRAETCFDKLYNREKIKVCRNHLNLSEVFFTKSFNIAKKLKWKRDIKLLKFTLDTFLPFIDLRLNSIEHMNEISLDLNHK